MQISKALVASLPLLIVMSWCNCNLFAQTTPPPVPMYATNTAGFIQFGPNGANNLVLFTVPLPPEPKPGGELPDPEPPVRLEFTVIGDLSSGTDANNDGVDDTLGNFAGLEWSTGVPGSGTLIGCVLNDDDGNGEIYRILPETSEATLIGKAPEGLVTNVGPIDDDGPGPGMGSGTGYFPTAPFSVPTVGGSGQGLSVVITTTSNGAITGVEVGSCGSGYQVTDLVTVQSGNFNGSVRVSEIIEATGFADLAVNPGDGRMYGILNHIDDTGGGETEFLPNTFWRDTDNDFIPDQKIALPLTFADFAPLQTLVGGIAFDGNGRLFVYDLVDEIVLGNIGGFLSALDDNPFGIDFGDTETELINLGDEIGSGLAVVNGDDMIIGTSTFTNETFISTFYIPPISPLGGPDPEPDVYRMADFERSFFQNNFFADVRIGDLVSAQTDFEDAFEVFPDAVNIIRGVPGDNAILEALAISDDLRFCVLPQVPETKGDLPVSLELVYTIPNPQDLTALGVEIEFHSNVPNLGQFFRALNVNTGQFDVLSFDTMLPVGNDDVITVDLTFFNLDNYVDPNNGTLKVQIDTTVLGVVPFYPWQMKYDAVLAVFEF